MKHQDRIDLLIKILICAPFLMLITGIIIGIFEWQFYRSYDLNELAEQFVAIGCIGALIVVSIGLFGQIFTTTFTGGKRGKPNNGRD